MPNISKLTLTLFAQLSFCTYAQTLLVVHEGTPVPITTVNSLSAASLQPGHYIDFRVTHAFRIGNAIIIPPDAVVIGEIAAVHKSLFRRTSLVDVRLIYVRAASGEPIPLRSGQHVQSDWRIGLIRGVIPIGVQNMAYVSRDVEVYPIVAGTAPPTPTDYPSVRWSASR